MSVKLTVSPDLNEPILVAGWPGIGNVGILAVDNLRTQLNAKSMGEIEPWEIFYPSGVVIKEGILTELNFPQSRFYFAHHAQGDVIIFIGDAQPAEGSGSFAGGEKAYRMANMVLDVAEQFKSKLIVTCGAAIAPSHHEITPAVWTVGTDARLVKNLNLNLDLGLVSKIQNKPTQAAITGLNGLLIGAAGKRGMDGVCIMGEIPDYLVHSPVPYPQSACSVLKMLAHYLGVTADTLPLESMSLQVKEVIDSIYRQFPPEILERLESRKLELKQEIATRAITDDDQRWLADHIDELFKSSGGEKHG